MTQKKKGFTFTFTDEQLKIIKASDKEKVTLVTKNGIKVEINKSEFKKVYANTLTVNLSLNKNRLIFGVSANGKSIQFSDYASISLPKKELPAPPEKIVILHEGKKGLEVVPHDVTDEGIVLKVKQGGQFKLSINKKSFHDKK